MVLADCEAMLVTQSEHGMTLVVRGGEAIHVPALPVKVRDVSGAGDTVAAVLARRWRPGPTGRRCGWRMPRPLLVVGKKGTAAVTPGVAAENPAACVAGGRREDRAQGGDLDAHLADWRKQGCASASPMAVSTSCIPATSRC